jgi:hypothetical protein
METQPWEGTAGITNFDLPHQSTYSNFVVPTLRS